MKAFFSGLVAIILLGLYVYAVWFAVSVVRCSSTSGCSHPSPESFTTGFALVLSAVGGLVSALVIGVLAITIPGDAPTAHFLPGTLSKRTNAVLKWVTALYLSVWLLTGLTAFIFGTLIHPAALQPLTDVGQAWLGLAVAAGYSYLEIKPAGT